MLRLRIQAYWYLLRWERALGRDDFSDLHARVRAFRVRSRNGAVPGLHEICGAIDWASSWYFKPVLCLQRSAATACLLRRHGIKAQMLIGVQQMPFRAHAWVEVNGVVANDRAYVREMYAVIEQV